MENKFIIVVPRGKVLFHLETNLFTGKQKPVTSFISREEANSFLVSLEKEMIINSKRDFRIEEMR